MTGSRLANNSPVNERQPDESMDFTDWMALLTVTAALFWAIDPFSIQLWRFPLTRHIPTFLAIVSILLCIAGHLLFRQNKNLQLRSVLIAYRELIFFAFFVISGSLYAKFGLNVENSFLSMGVFLLLGGPTNLWIIKTSNSPTILIRNISVAFVVIALLAVAANVLQFGKLIFHALEHVVLVPVAIALFIKKNISLRLISILLAILGSVSQNKFTGYIVLLIVFGWVFLDELMTWTAKETDRIQAGLKRIFGFCFALLLTGTVIIVYEVMKSQLPDGNSTYRLYTYERAFNRFLESWLWGRGFTAPAVDFFDLFVVSTSTQFLPTHSDPLDILANGGLLAAIPFSVGLFSILHLGWKTLRCNWTLMHPVGGIARAQLIMYFLCLLSGISVMAFNPILNTTTLAYVYWTCSAVMLALVDTVNIENAKSSNQKTQKTPV